MAEATKIDWAEELREEMKKGREGAAKNALSGEDDTFAEWSESFEEGQSPADLAGAESEGAGVGWTLSELIVPGVGEAMDLRMMEEGRQEGDQTKVAMGMIGLALPGALGAVWRKFGGPVARRLAKKVADKEITPKEAAVRATKHSMKKLKEKTDAQDKASGLSIEARKHFDPEAIEDSWKGVDLKQDLDFLEAQPDEWFEKAASVRNVDQAMDRLKIAQSQAKGAAKWRRTRLSEAEEGVKSARAASPTSRHEDLLRESEAAHDPYRNRGFQGRVGDQTRHDPLNRMRADRNKVVQRVTRRRGASPDDPTREALNKHLMDPDVMEARGHLPPVKGEMKWEWEPGERMESALYDRSLPRQPRWKGTDEAGEVTEVWEELASPSRSKVRQHGTPIKGSGQVVYGEW